ncbi:MAG: SEC-C domain-containing protein [Burkholderiales bacterium]|nr:SEC-C domain-containing protein [Burkholderiales bacterium]
MICVCNSGLKFKKCAKLL